MKTSEKKKWCHMHTFFILLVAIVSLSSTSRELAFGAEVSILFGNKTFAIGDKPGMLPMREIAMMEQQFRNIAHFLHNGEKAAAISTLRSVALDLNAFAQAVVPAGTPSAECLDKQPDGPNGDLIIFKRSYHWEGLDKLTMKAHFMGEVLTSLARTVESCQEKRLLNCSHVVESLPHTCTVPRIVTISFPYPGKKRTVENMLIFPEAVLGDFLDEAQNIQKSGLKLISMDTKKFVSKGQSTDPC